MFVFTHVIVCHVYVVFVIAWCERVDDVERCCGDVVTDEQGVPLAFVSEVVGAAGVVGVEVVLAWEHKEAARARTYTREVELGCEGRHIGGPRVAQGLGEPQIIFGCNELHVFV